MKNDMLASIRRGESAPFILGAIRGPVSVNPIGAYDGLLVFTIFPAGSMQTEWNSFNVGEFWFPQSRLSLLPWLVIWGGLVTVLIVVAVRRDRAVGKVMVGS